MNLAAIVEGHPEEALAPMTAALEGLPATLDAAALAEAVEQAIPPGTELMGFSPEAIAIAVRSVPFPFRMG